MNAAGRLALALLACPALAACGLGMSQESLDAGSGPPSQDAGPSACPSAEPTIGGACQASLAGVSCEYGTDPVVACNHVYQCTTSLRWSELPPTTFTTCPTTGHNDARCPSSRASVPAGKTCGATAFSCAYASPQGICACGPGSSLVQILPDGGVPPFVWVCDVATTTGCPEPRPHLGAACAANGLTCDYASCVLPPPDGVQLSCNGGTWQQRDFGCPL